MTARACALSLWCVCVCVCVWVGVCVVPNTVSQKRLTSTQFGLNGTVLYTAVMFGH